MDSAVDWRLPAAAIVVHMAGIGGTLGITYPLTSLALADHGATAFEVGLTAAMASLSIVVSMPVLPRLLQRVAAVPAMVVGCAVAALSILAMPWFANVAAWMALRFTMGVGLAIPWLLGEVWLNRVTPEHHRGRVMAAYTASMFAGFAIGPALLTEVGTAGWVPFATAAALLLLAVLPLIPFATSTGLTPRARPHKPARVPMAVCIGAVSAGFAHMASLALLPTFASARGLTNSEALWSLTAFLIGGLALQAPVGWLSTRVSRRGLLSLLGAVGAVGMLAMQALPPSLVAIGVTGFFVGGASVGVYSGTLTLLGTQVADRDLPRANARFLTLYELGGLAGPLVGGAALGASSSAFPISIALAFVVLVPLVALSRTSQSNTLHLRKEQQ